jgi:hypothetical protein
MTRSEDGALGCMAVIVGAALALFALNVLGL